MKNSRLQEEPGIAVFRCRDCLFTVGDITQAAQFRGELEPLWQKVLGLTECEQKAEELGLEIDDTSLQTMAETFRFERDLITAEETEQWLEQRGLTLDDFSDYFARHYWASTLTTKAGPKAIEYLSAPAEMRDLLRVELLLSGELDAMALRLSWRVAASETADGELGSEVLAVERKLSFERAKICEAALSRWLEQLGCDQSWFDEMIRLDAIYHRQCDALLTTEACQRAIAMFRMSLTQLDLETMEVESRDSADEAFLCVRDDGMSLRQLATEGRYPYRRAKVMLDDLPANSQQRFLCAAAGNVVEPMPRGDGFQLCRIIEKIEPTLADPAVRNRVERRLLDRHFSDLVATHIHWLIAPNPAHEREG